MNKKGTYNTAVDIHIYIQPKTQDHTQKDSNKDTDMDEEIV